MKAFRDALAHHIPLYIPPYMIVPNHLSEYEKLGNAAKMLIALRSVMSATSSR
jgi:hypothetical protein